MANKLNHEDKGIMAQAVVCGGGCDALWNEINACRSSGHKPCLYSQYEDYCAPGNPGQFGTF